ncbi:hypothetical protein [Pseudomonas mosselii]|uniref:hypothetical protein n=1 Tax=Pseudomonas mosselii TaxID=78327 RepID=UPI0021DB7DD7|nr:hypothetical protein [Pseudomonas mosselii]MCU9528541.1 hypothetical protein [Pseudomonas mosselii]MCU9535875.1 hypothetical protein [Pseudomonas mosselii]MCU9542933.1 hypothetical protein [Pseudomonas mosselii]MCU9548814.1 hypothetical protein [Pseudomonas mosselii]
MNTKNLRGDVVLFVALANDLITPWEAGRLAALQQGALSDNPFKSDTRDHDEWARGFDQGVKDGSLAAEAKVDGSVETPYPLMDAKCLPAPSFWAQVNRLQQSSGLQSCMLASRVGMSEEQLKAGMVSHHFWDADGIPLGIRVAS